MQKESESPWVAVLSSRCRDGYRSDRALEKLENKGERKH
jgi:hypothetical protein